MSRAKKFAFVFAVVGLAVPLTILLAKAYSASGFSPIWIYYVWPTYFILGGMAGEIDAVTVAYLIAAILLNVALYAYIGSIIGRLLRGGHESTTNGT
jgi:hypothetical protein